MKDLKHTLDIQLFAEGDPIPPVVVTPPEIDYDKLAETISKRTSATEESALKGILKEQGVSKDEMGEAIRAYKESKETKSKVEQERIDKLVEENNNYKKEKLLESVTSEAKMIAKELNVRDDRFGKLMALCNSSKFMDENGKIDKDTIKKEFEAQLKDLPEFTTKKKIVITTGKGSDTPPEMTDEEEFRRRKYGKSKYFKG